MLFWLVKTGSNAEAGEVDEKTIPALMITSKERKTWMQGQAREALALQASVTRGRQGATAGYRSMLPT
jgi:hypothetical protein